MRVLLLRPQSGMFKTCLHPRNLRPPFLLKYLVDALDGQTVQAVAPGLLAGLVLAYGAARFSNVLFAELRDTIFGRVTERAMRRIGLQVFRHVHALDLEFHLNRRTGGLARDIERGTTGISFHLCLQCN